VNSASRAGKKKPERRGEERQNLGNGYDKNGNGSLTALLWVEK